jgi:zinc protease
MRAILLLTCALFAAVPAFAQELSIPHKKVELANGLDVIVHEDHSDPIVAVYVFYHVGSGREVPGRSGFAHLFEHLMFQGSANVGDDQHFKLIQEAGGTLNGTTNTDRTNYFETLPANQLELALWLEADRMGFLAPAITQEKLDNQREVVKNERRQNYENRPYGLEGETVVRNLYPPDHPYSWTTIGSMDDLNAASLEDVTGFLRRWYGPNNATLAIGGDVDTDEVLALVERYFGPIPRGPEVAKPAPRPANLASEKRIVLQDRVQLPQLSITWPTVAADHADEAALDLLARLLSSSKSAVLDKALTMDAQLASSVSAFHSAAELAGVFTITLRPQPGVTLDELEERADGLIAGVARDGVAPAVLERLKTVREASVVRGLETVGSRTSSLARDNTFRGQPDCVARDLARYRAVSADDVLRVLKAYVIDKPAVIVSVVPEGKPELCASGRTGAQRTAEAGLDRHAQPAPAAARPFRAPEVWRSTLANGTEVLGTRYDELPLTNVELHVPAGRLQEDPAHLGLASLTADLLDEGTRRLTSTELDDAFDALGANFSVSARDDDLVLALNVLDAHLDEAVALLEEVLLEPRLDQRDFERLKKERLTNIGVRADNIRSITGDAWNALMFGRESVQGLPSVGTAETVGRLTVADASGFWKEHATPHGSRLIYVGARDAAGVAKLFGTLAGRWREGKAVAASAPRPAPTPAAAGRRVYLVDKPGAAQSEIRIGHPSVSALDPAFDKLEVLNYVLGGGFSSRINLNLREDKGYTYGARSGFAGDLRPGPFTASAGVHTAVTAPSVTEFLKELERIRSGVTAEELAFARSAMLQGMDRRFESTRALATYLDELGRYDRADDFLVQRRAMIETIGADELARLAAEYLHPERMTILVVGDKQKILPDLQALNLGEIVELDASGRPLPPAGGGASDATEASGAGG